MSPLIKFLALVVVYLLIVYMIPIKRKGQSALLWIILIVVQGVSFYFFDKIKGLIGRIGYFSNLSDKVISVVTIIALLIINLIFILIVNMVNEKKVKDNMGEEVVIEEEVIHRSSDDYGALVSTSKRSELQLNPDRFNFDDFEENIDSMDLDGDIGFSNRDNGINLSMDALNVDDDGVFQTIQDLIINGKKEEATKYLKMVVFFSKNEEYVRKAKMLLDRMD